MTVTAIETAVIVNRELVKELLQGHGASVMRMENSVACSKVSKERFSMRSQCVDRE